MLEQHLAATGEPPLPDTILSLACLVRALQQQRVQVILTDHGAMSKDQDVDVVRAAAQAALLANEHDVELVCPLLDSRLGEPGSAGRGQLGELLKRRAPRELAALDDLPAEPAVLTQLRRDGRAHSLVEWPRTLGLVSEQMLRQWQQTQAEPLYRLVCLDLWHRLFVEAPATARQSSAISERVA
jgi:hypothetical protein